MGRPRLTKSDTLTKEKKRINKQRERNIREVTFILCRSFSHSCKYGRVSIPDPVFLNLVADTFMPKRFKEKIEKLQEFTRQTRLELAGAYYSYEDGTFRFDLSTEERNKAHAESDIISRLVQKVIDGTLEPLSFGYGADYVLPLDNIEVEKHE